MRLANAANTPRATLARLASGTDTLLSRLVAQRKDLTFDLQRICASSDDEPTRRAVAMCANTSPEVLVWLAADSSVQVRAEVAGNPNTPAEVLARLTGEDDWDVAVAAVANPNLDPARLPRLLAAAVRVGDPQLIAVASEPWSDIVVDTVALLEAGSNTMGPREMLEVAIGLNS